MGIARQNSLRIEDYALIGDCRSAALVGRDGSIDWLCWPRFDSGACLSALLGDASNGRFHIAPAADAGARLASSRRYAGPTMVLETIWETGSGTVVLTDFMVPETETGTLVRVVECREGTVDMRMELCLRFDYGQSVPWVTRRRGGNGVVAISGPDMVVLRTDVDLWGEDMETVADFTVTKGERIPFVLTHCASHLPVPQALDHNDLLHKTMSFWESWSARSSYTGEWSVSISRSLLTLKSLTDRVTGGIVAAPTTSLPEEIGGLRNWDYRFCWLRDATLTLFAFMKAGYYDEAGSWAEWLQRSAAGRPDQVQIMYGIGGERRLEEWEVDSLAGYEGSKPVRIGNAASKQVQLDIYGEVCEALNQARRGKLLASDFAWPLQCQLLAHLETIWHQPDSGLWETRGGEKHFTFSKVMAWVAFARSIDDAETNGLKAPLDRWRGVRDEIFAAVCSEGFNAELNSFTQSFGSTALDASLLLIPVVGFLPGDDERVRGTIAAVEAGLVEDGFVLRYRAVAEPDGLPGQEGAFLACSFWLAQAMCLSGREDEARAQFKRLVALCNDVGLLSEEFDPKAKRFTGNFPQAFSHVALVTTALMLDGVRQ